MKKSAPSIDSRFLTAIEATAHTGFRVGEIIFRGIADMQQKMFALAVSGAEGAASLLSSGGDRLMQLLDAREKTSQRK
jgi:hypothetical protein